MTKGWLFQCRPAHASEQCGEGRCSGSGLLYSPDGWSERSRPPGRRGCFSPWYFPSRRGGTDPPCLVNGSPSRGARDSSAEMSRPRPVHSSHRGTSPADSPLVYFATMPLLDHRLCRMIAESGVPAPLDAPSKPSSHGVHQTLFRVSLSRSSLSGGTSPAGQPRQAPVRAALGEVQWSCRRLMKSNGHFLPTSSGGSRRCNPRRTTISAWRSGKRRFTAVMGQLVRRFSALVQRAERSIAQAQPAGPGRAALGF